MRSRLLNDETKIRFAAIRTVAECFQATKSFSVPRTVANKYLAYRCHALRIITATKKSKTSPVFLLLSVLTIMFDLYLQCVLLCAERTCLKESASTQARYRPN